MFDMGPLCHYSVLSLLAALSTSRAAAWALLGAGQAIQHSRFRQHFADGTWCFFRHLSVLRLSPSLLTEIIITADGKSFGSRGKFVPARTMRMREAINMLRIRQRVGCVT